MPASPTTAAADVVNGVDPHVPRVIFFGPPHSGKSALIGRIVRTASRHGSPAVELTPADPPDSIRRELVPHLIRVDNPSAGPGGGQFEIVDCDGRAALLQPVEE